MSSASRASAGAVVLTWSPPRRDGPPLLASGVVPGRGRFLGSEFDSTPRLRHSANRHADPPNWYACLKRGSWCFEKPIDEPLYREERYCMSPTSILVPWRADWGIEAAYYCDPPALPPLASRVRPRGSGQAAGGNVMRVALCTKECAQRHSHTSGTAPARSRLVACEAWVTNGAPVGLGEGTP